MAHAMNAMRRRWLFAENATSANNQRPPCH